jgi:hypothetical protein
MTKRLALLLLGALANAAPIAARAAGEDNGAALPKRMVQDLALSKDN